MNVVLIAPPLMDYVQGRLRPISMDAERECPPYGIYLLASILRAEGHQVTLMDLIAHSTSSIKSYRELIKASHLIGIAATSMSWAAAQHVITQVRQLQPEVPIVLGGIHPTMFDEYILRHFPVDYIVRGEGELALPALCRALMGEIALDTVPNLSWRTPTQSFIRNTLAPKIAPHQLGQYPLPDYSTLPNKVYKGLAIESSRGCSFDCSFCSTSYRKDWRGIPPDCFVDRLEQIMPHLDRTRYGTIHIIDDEFSMNPRRATEIAQTIRRRGLKPWLVYDSRATDLLWEGYVENIAEFTCQFLVGAECGYDEGLKRIGKGTTCQILESAARKLHEFGISNRADFSFILGLPWETKADVEKTIQFAVHLFTTYGVRILLQWYCQIPGSRLWEEDKRNGLVNETMYNDYGFFRDLYLFRTGVKLTPAEIYEVGDMVAQLQYLAGLHTPQRRMIEFAFPQAIYDNFPRELLTSTETGLTSLRQVSRPTTKARGQRITTSTSESAPQPPTFPAPGIARRHFPGYQ